MDYLLPTGLGAITGLLLGLTGAGGGILAAPLLMLLMHQSVTDAAPISLIAVAFGALLGMLLGLREGVVRYRAAMLLSAMGLLASPLGIYLSRILPNTPLMLAFAAILAFQAQRYWRGGNLPRDKALPCVVNEATGRFIWSSSCFRMMTLLGLTAGFMSGLLGVGGGFVLVPSLRRHTALTMHSIAATSLTVLAVVSAGGVVQWLAVGGVKWAIGLPFIAGAIVGMGAGRHMAPQIPEDWLRKLFAGLCFVVCLGLLAKVGISL